MGTSSSNAGSYRWKRIALACAAAPLGGCFVEVGISEADNEDGFGSTSDHDALRRLEVSYSISMPYRRIEWTAIEGGDPLAF